LERLLSYEYLLEPTPGPPGPFRLLYGLMAAATLGSMLTALLLWRRRCPGWGLQAAALQILTGAAGILLLICAALGIPVLSMRLLVFSSNFGAVLVPPIALVALREPAGVWARHARAARAQLAPHEPPLRAPTQGLLLLMHLIGLAWLCLHMGWPAGWAVFILAAMLLPQFVQARRVRAHLEMLGPLFLAYGAMGLRVLALAILKMTGYEPFALPAAWDRALNVEAVAILAISWTLAAQLFAAARTKNREAQMVSMLAACGLILTFAWAGYTYLRLRTHGTTGTDPYCYAQMAVDWASTGFPTHSFPLVRTLSELGVGAEAAVHLGYHLPFKASGEAATVWPVGQAGLLALGYLVAGEVGLYVTTPLLALLSLVALCGLSWELLRHRAQSERAVVSALAVFLLATSYAQVERLLVPMADAAAQLFTTLTLWAWMRAQVGKRSSLWAATAGLALAMAYHVRHTQLLVLAGILWTALLQRRSRRTTLTRLTIFGLSALLIALPDLAYHQRVMGQWLRPESLELRHFALSFVGPMARRLLADLLARWEFLYLAPLLLVGLWRHWREDSAHAALLAGALLGLLAIHLPYEALRLRDLLPVFPLLCFWTANGVPAVWEAMAKSRHWVQRQSFLNGLSFATVLSLLLWLRSGYTLSLAGANDFDGFGYLNASQRASFGRIGVDTPASAWIGASLNSGPIDIYAQRTTFRPEVWTSDELLSFLGHAQGLGRPIYLMDDGLEMALPLRLAAEHYELQLVSEYDLPYYYVGGGSLDTMVPLYLLLPRHPQRRNG